MHSNDVCQRDRCHEYLLAIQNSARVRAVYAFNDDEVVICDLEARWPDRDRTALPRRTSRKPARGGSNRSALTNGLNRHVRFGNLVYVGTGRSGRRLARGGRRRRNQRGEVIVNALYEVRQKPAARRPVVGTGILVFMALVGAALAVILLSAISG